jgi:hypothetical protein
MNERQSLVERAIAMKDTIAGHEVQTKEDYDTYHLLTAFCNLLRPIPGEIEGGGHSWYYVCGECHGAIDREDRFCKHCGYAITWEEK